MSYRCLTAFHDEGSVTLAQLGNESIESSSVARDDRPRRLSQQMLCPHVKNKSRSIRGSFQQRVAEKIVSAETDRDGVIYYALISFLGIS